MISLQLQDSLSSQPNAAFFSSSSPFKLQLETSSSSGISDQSSINYNNNNSNQYQGSPTLSEEKIHNNFMECPQQMHPHLLQQDSTDESNNNQENLSVTSQQAGEDSNYKKSKLHNISLSEIKKQHSNQKNSMQIICADDDSNQEEGELCLPQIYDNDDEEEGDNENDDYENLQYIISNKFSCDQEYETEQIELYQDLKESNDIYSLVSIKGNRKEMHDKYSTFIAFGNLNFYAVFDGHGNDKIANYLKDNLFSSIYNHPSFFTNIEEAITQSFIQLDAYFQDNEDFSGSGCVCVCALVVNGNLYIANLGDCRAVLFDKHGNSRDLSFDHTPSNRKDEVERIASQNGFCLRSGSQLRVSGELNVTRAFGDKRYKPFIIAQPEILVYDIGSLLNEFEYRDVFLVLASDGLWNDYNANHSQSLCNSGYEQFPERSLEHIYEQKQCYRDNTTVMSVNLQNYYLSLLNSYQQSQQQQSQQQQQQIQENNSYSSA